MNFIFKSIEDLRFAGIISNSLISKFKLIYTKTGRVHLSIRMLNSNKFLNLIGRYYLRSFNIEIKSYDFKKHVFLPHPQNIIIGANITFNGNISICQGVTIGGNFQKSSVNIKYPVFQDQIWLGPNSVIGGPVTISDNVLVGANSVVTKNVSSNTIVFGQNKCSSKKIKFNHNMSSYETIQ